MCVCAWTLDISQLLSVYGIYSPRYRMTFFDNRRQCLCLGIHYCVDEIVSPVLGHVQCRMTVAVLLVHASSARKEGRRGKWRGRKGGRERERGGGGEAPQLMMYVDAC